MGRRVEASLVHRSSKDLFKDGGPALLDIEEEVNELSFQHLERDDRPPNSNSTHTIVYILFPLTTSRVISCPYHGIAADFALRLPPCYCYCRYGRNHPSRTFLYSKMCMLQSISARRPRFRLAGRAESWLLLMHSGCARRGGVVEAVVTSLLDNFLPNVDGDKRTRT